MSAPMSQPSDSLPPAPLEPLSIRPMVEDDLRAVLEIEKQSYPLPWTKDHFMKEFDKPYSTQWVLTDDETDEKVAAYAVFWEIEKSIELLNIAVHPDLRGKGLGQRMLQQVAKQGVKNECVQILLDVRRSNLSAIQLYQKLGFTIQQIRKGFYSSGEDAFHMTLSLVGEKIEF